MSARSQHTTDVARLMKYHEAEAKRFDQIARQKKSQGLTRLYRWALTRAAQHVRWAKLVESWLV